MGKVYDVTEGEKVKGVSTTAEQDLADRWRITMKECERSGRLYAAGIGVISSLQR